MSKKDKNRGRKRSEELMRSIQAERKKSSPPEWAYGLVRSPDGELTYFPPSSMLWINPEIISAEFRDALRFATRYLKNETKLNIEEIVIKILNTIYREDMMFGGRYDADGAKAFLRGNIKAAKSTLKKVEKDSYNNSYEYGLYRIRPIIEDNIKQLETLLKDLTEIKKKRSDYSDASAAIKDAVKQVAALDDGHLKTHDQIGLVILASGLFQHIRCIFNDDLKIGPRIDGNGLQVVPIPLDKWPNDLRTQTQACQYLETSPKHEPRCLYSTKGYGVKATERIQRILPLKKSNS